MQINASGKRQIPWEIDRLTESPFVWGQQPLIWGLKRLRGKGDVPQVSGNAYGEAGEGQRESIVCAR